MGKINIIQKCHQSTKESTEPKPSSVNSPENLEPKDSPPRPSRIPSWESPSQPSEDLPEEVESRESAHSSMTRPEPSSRLSSRTSSETQSPTPSTPRERPSLPSMSSMLSRDKAELSMVSEVEQFCLLNAHND